MSKSSEFRLYFSSINALEDMTNEESKNKVKDTFYNASIKHWRSRAGLVFVNKKNMFSSEIPLMFLQ